MKIFDRSKIKFIVNPIVISDINRCGLIAWQKIHDILYIPERGSYDWQLRRDLFFKAFIRVTRDDVHVAFTSSIYEGIQNSDKEALKFLDLFQRHEKRILDSWGGEPDPEQIKRSCLWIDRFGDKTKTPRPRYGSYWLKHVIEAWTRHIQKKDEPFVNPYCTNGAFIVAALIEGYTAYSILPNDGTVHFNMSIKKWTRCLDACGRYKESQMEEEK